MAATRSVIRDRIRKLIHDENPGDYTVGSEGLNTLLEARATMLANRAGFGISQNYLLGAIPVAAGTDEYTLSAAEYSALTFLRLRSQGWMLTKRTRQMIQDMQSGSTDISGNPTDYSVHETTTQTLKIKLYPKPNASDNIDILQSLLPSFDGTDSQSFPFSDPMVGCLVFDVAALLIEGMTDDKLAKLALDRGVAKAYRAESERSLSDEMHRINRLKRTGRIVQVEA